MDDSLKKNNLTSPQVEWLMSIDDRLPHTRYAERLSKAQRLEFLQKSEFINHLGSYLDAPIEQEKKLLLLRKISFVKEVRFWIMNLQERREAGEHSLVQGVKYIIWTVILAALFVFFILPLIRSK